MPILIHVLMYSWWTATWCNTISGWWHITDDFIAWFNTVEMYITKRFKNLLYRLIHACTVLHIHVHVCVVKSKRKKQTIFWGRQMKCSHRANMNKILQWDLDNKQMGKMPAFSLIYCTKPLNASTRLDYFLFWVNILKDLCYVIFRKVYTYMAWTEICYICWLFLPSYIIIFFSNFFLFSLSLSVFDFLYSSRMFFHLCK